MQYPESSQRTRIEDECPISRNANMLSHSDTMHKGIQEIPESLKGETPKPDVPRANVSSFLKTVLSDWPPPEKPPPNPTSPGPPCRKLDSTDTKDRPAQSSRHTDYQLSYTGYGGYPAPSLSTSTHPDSPVSSSSDPGYDRMSDFSDHSAYLPPPALRRGSPAGHGYHSDGDTACNRLSTGSCNSLKSWESSEAERPMVSPPKKPKKKSKMHQCDICGKWFPRPSGLRTHINTHTKARPYACWIPGCNKSFAARSNAKRHLLTHGIDTSAKGQGDPFLLDFATPTVLESPIQLPDDARWSGNLRWMSPESVATDNSGSPKALWLSA